ncbi:adenylate/guanylate cyclase domain-containing protein [Kamptonema sp. UHCC 0994]|uniref:adenylate/guanylate cyclase domain-containing protein n=1 Tax=Kamptonema sp. UHCC 0994 TaxID=3031329 RepID=UPI0023B9003D|nr:adenylate/guanylate cyclase domain-containing protein [Kamptonema sp. UHCC 0994]MDF0554884.1 adenylate/guanylate cyclase domain-containing protein [Kamptonema sp. UHCC 0994]
MTKQTHQQSKNVWKNQLKGNRTSAFLTEILSNSGHFFILKSLSSLIFADWFKFITDPAIYVLVVGMLVQAWYLSKSNCNRFWGNLINVSIYTLIDVPLDGLDFFQDPSHAVFWLFSLMIATLQGLRFLWVKSVDYWLIPLESLVRALMVVAFYVVVGIKSQSLMINPELIVTFSRTAMHGFLTWSMVFIGLLLGLQSQQVAKQQQQLQATAQLLGNMAEWGMGSHVVETALNNPEALAFQACDRTILFMDIRGFTSWCEKTSPARVATILNEYYRCVEPLAAQFQPLRITFTGDEIMVIYATPQQGIAAAKSMNKAVFKLLEIYGIGAGCGVHCGSVIEGLFGGEDVRTYTVIGDAVNTAKRLESATPGGAITISDAVYQAMSQHLQVEPCEPIVAKGKTAALIAWRLI